jgi:hypothetical protein
MQCLHLIRIPVHAQMPQWYLDTYPEGPGSPLWGLLTGRSILALHMNAIYTAPYYLALMALLAASLVACTYTRQWPMVKVRPIPFAPSHGWPPRIFFTRRPYLLVVHGAAPSGAAKIMHGTAGQSWPL